ncbi:unnamed protein product [Discula destructiva]
MAGSTVFGSGVDLIDLTNSDEDDVGPALQASSRATQQQIANGGANGQKNSTYLKPRSSHTTTSTQSHIRAPALNPPPVPQHRAGDEPPAKRARLHSSTDSAYALVLPYAEAGARQAAKEDPRLIELVLRGKLLEALLHRFGNCLTQQLTLNGGIDSLRAEVLAASKVLLRQLITLPACRQPFHPPVFGPAKPTMSSPAPASTPSNARPWPSESYGISRPGSAYNGRPLPTTSPPVHQTNTFRSPAPPNGLPDLRQPQNTPTLNGPARQSRDLASGVGGGSSPNHEAQRQQSPLPQAPPSQAPAARGPVLRTPGAWESSPLVTATQVKAQPIPASPTPNSESSLSRPLSRDTMPQNVLSSTPRHPRRRDLPGTPTSAKEARTNVNAPTTPQNFHARARTAQWKSDNSGRIQTNPTSYFALKRRPYVGTKGKQAILRGNGRLSRLKLNLLQKSEVFHVDFAPSEVHQLLGAARKAVNKPEKASSGPHRDLEKLLRKLKEPAIDLARLAVLVSPAIPAREEDDVRAFLDDILHKRVVSQEQQLLSVEKDPFDTRGEDLHNSRLASLLLAREISGNRYGGMRHLEHYTNEFRKTVESSVQIRSEFTNCAGDLSTISWISDEAYIAGTTVHMDSHNQQYNKLGNLVLGSVSRGKATLKAYADHRIIRPIIEQGENSSAAMRETQDPWLYTSVVFSDYDPIHDRLYTCSFDKTVKIWKVEKPGGSMRCIGTWEHGGPVNFVQASLYQHRGAGLVATAADVPSDAVRIYEVSSVDDGLSRSNFAPFSCSRIMNADGTPLVTDKWTYFPSTMKWGIEKSVQQYLLVGYSPRSLKGDDGDIPPESLNTGEICLWDASTRDRVPITSAKTQNVFEVLWHPSQPYFIAATSPKGVDYKENRVRTQVRIFRRVSITGMGTCFSEWKALDCMAADINELTIMPNSVIYCYVTAGCTDGKTYVWDTALGDKPIQILTHGPPLEGIRIDDAEDDTGVKFTAWGSSLDRFYTGSSDGVVKVWNVRSEKKAKGKVILEASAQISCGAFSPDRSRLIVGDASGRVFVLSVDEDDGKPPTFIKLPGAHGSIKRRIPTEVEHHAAPPPPPGAVVVSGVSAAREFLAARQLRLSDDPTVGAVQDVNYASTGFFRKEFHLNYDPSQELLAQHTARQLDDTKLYSNALPRTKRLRRLTYTPMDAEGPVDPDDGRKALLQRHEENCKLDLKFESLSLEIRDVLSSSGIGQRELLEGCEYPDVVEDDEAELKRGQVELPKEALEEPVFWG